MATIEEIYQQVFGRAPDPAGAAYWGPTIDAAELAQIMASPEAQGMMSAPAPAYEQSYDPSVAAQPVYTTVQDLYSTYLKRAPDAAGMQYWTQQFGNSVDTNEVRAFLDSVAKSGNAQDMAAIGVTNVPTGGYQGPAIAGGNVAFGGGSTGLMTPPPTATTATTTPTPASQSAAQQNQLSPGMVGSFVSPWGTVIEYDANGKQFDTQRSPTGQMTPWGSFGVESNQTLTPSQVEAMLGANMLPGQEQFTSYKTIADLEAAKPGLFRVAAPVGSGVGYYEIEKTPDGKYITRETGGHTSLQDMLDNRVNESDNSILGMGTGVDLLALGGLGLWGSGLLGGAGAAGAGTGIGASGTISGATGLGGIGSGASFGGAALGGANLAAAGAVGTAATLLSQGVTPAVLAANGVTAAEMAAMGFPASMLASAGIPGAASLAGATTAAGAATGTVASGAGTAAGTAAAGGLLSGAGSLTPALIGAGANLIGGALQNETNKDIAAQNAANIAAQNENAKFRPVGVTTRFGQSNFGYDANGRLTSAGYTLSPELKALQDRQMGMLPQLQTDYERAAQLGRGAMKTPEQYMQEQLGLLSPTREQGLAAIRNQAQQTGRMGLATGGTSTTMATNPEMAAYYNAIQQENARLAANAPTQSLSLANQGLGLMSSGYAPFATALGGSQNMETLGQHPMDLGTTIGGNQSTANARLQTPQVPNQVNPWTAGLMGGLNAYNTYQNQQRVTTQNPYVPQPTQTVAQGGDYSWNTQQNPYPNNEWNFGTVNPNYAGW